MRASRANGPLLAALCLLILISHPALAQPAPVTVSLVPNDPTVGDPIQATITLRTRISDRAGEPRFPAWGNDKLQAGPRGRMRPRC